LKVVLTGSNGFLGSHLVKTYLEDGYEVIALVRSGANTTTLHHHQSLFVEKIDYQGNLVSQFQNLKEKFGAVEVFIHNAGITVSLDPHKYFEINTHLTGKIIKAIEACDWLKDSGKLVHISSLAAQGPIGINKPVSKYGHSKLKAESLFKKSKYDYLIVRPTAIYGAGDYAFLPLLKGAKSKVYPLTNAQQKMSMIHGQDLAYIILKESKTGSGTIHAADGITYLHSDFIAALSKVFNKKIYIVPVPAGLIKLILSISDIWHRLVHKRPNITKEKFHEISMDWNQHEFGEIPYSQVPCQISLEEGFKDAYEFYRAKKLI